MPTRILQKETYDNTNNNQSVSLRSYLLCRTFWSVQTCMFLWFLCNQ